MFLDKFRNRYSFNFLSVCGWIIIILCAIFTLPELYIEYIVGNTAHALGVGITFLGILCLNIIFFILTFLIYVFEIISWKRITNEKFLNNKYIKLIQTLGISFAFLPILILILFFAFSLLKSVVYNIQGVE